jgi:hypothetical protein
VSAKSRSGSDLRSREPDVRIRLTPDEVTKLDTCVHAAGLKGQRARGDWLRRQIGAAPAPDVERAIHRRVPLSGGQAVLAELGKAGVNLQKLVRVLERIPDRDLPPADLARIRADVPRMVAEAICKIETAVDGVTLRLDQLAERTRG